MSVVHTEKTIHDYVAEFGMASFLNEQLLGNLKIFHFPAYSHVFIESEEQNYLYFLVEGQVQCNHYHLNGKLAVIAVSNPLTAIGDIEILTDEPVHSNVITTQNTSMLGISRSNIHRYGANDPKFLRFLIEQLRQKLYETNVMQKNQVLSVNKRLALYILAHAKKDENSSIVLPDKEALAALLGSTIRHLNRVLKELVEAHYISDSYPLVRILDEASLQNLTA